LFVNCEQESNRPSTEKLALLSDGAVGVSLLGERLFSTPQSSGEAYEKMLEAKEKYEKNPGDADAIIWYGRRLAYTGRYIEAINVYSEGLKKHPEESRLYRHRGHRFLTLRMLDRAIEDFEYATTLFKGKKDVIEPDGNPNIRNTPISSLQINTWYHLALCYYMKNDMNNSLRGWNECLKVSVNPDMFTATSHWLYMTLRRMGRDQDAEEVLEPITEDMDVFENMAYYYLLLFYKGIYTEEDLFSKESSVLGYMFEGTKYGLANWYYYNGNIDKAKNMFQEIVDKPGWGSFAAITAEADLSRMK
ncbi:tetratricopeptide repeat protein, partial [candidate division KSB1 bacterium]